MSLKPGARFGPYEITAPLGAGGMGEVYRATDRKLSRDVGIKVLPSDFAQDPERLARFEREAKVLASLNHNNIAAIYGLEEADDDRCLVLELVEGQTLAEIISEGALPIERAARVALQIAEALEAAHEKGIIHRDLKPANVKVTPEGVVKVLDFGLAKAFGEEDSGRSKDASLSPTLTEAATRAGVILGTAAYMSPEQAAGQAADRRADIWSFGAVFMEMLTGRRQFTGETVSHTLASVLKEEPRWDQLPPELPPRLAELVKACLRKKARQRLQSIGDARVVLEEYLADPASFEAAVEPVATVTEAVPVWKRLLPWAMTGVLSLALLGTLWALWFGGAETAAPRRLSIQAPESRYLFQGYGSSMVISPDGSRIAYVMSGQDGRELHFQFLDQWEGKIIASAGGNLGPYQPFFSPDGEWVGFVTPSEMKKVPVRGGTPITLCKVSYNRGSSWGADGNIIFAPTPDGGLFRVSAAGGEPEPLTELNKEAGEITHRWPQILPGGRAVLFTSLTEGNRFENGKLEILNLETGERKVLHQGATYGRYVESGHLLYVNQATLFAIPFDLKTLETTGSAAPLVAGITSERGQGGAQYDVSSNGTLIYAAGGTESGGVSLVWVDREGNTSPLWDEAQDYANPRLSPDGTRLSLDIETESNRDIWVYDLERDVPTRLTFAEGTDRRAVWSADGQYLYFGSDRDGEENIYRKAADGSGEAELIFKRERTQFPISVSPDGKLLAFIETGADTATDIWILNLEQKDAEPELYFSSPKIDYGAKFSPDGRWIAYGSAESGQFEVYVRPASGGRGKWQVSAGEAAWPEWSKDGKQLFFRSSGKIMSVQVETGGETFRASRAEPLLEDNFVGRPDGNNYYEVAGDRFIMMQGVDQSSSSNHQHFQVVLNWFDEIQRTFAIGTGSSR